MAVDIVVIRVQPLPNLYNKGGETAACFSGEYETRTEMQTTDAGAFPGWEALSQLEFAGNLSPQRLSSQGRREL